MLKVEYQGQFKKDYKLAVKRGCNPKLLADVITMLVMRSRCRQSTKTIAWQIPGIIKE